MLELGLPHSDVAKPCVLAFGAYLKNTLCLMAGERAWLSSDVGDLGTAQACEKLDQTVQAMLATHALRPVVVAHDLHPDFYSTRAAIGFANQHGLPALAVQHHHAHIAAVCAEQGWCAPVLGLALDGFGLGTDGTSWGGELLRVEGAHFQRLGHLRPLSMPGGDTCAREPWRMAASVLHASGRSAEIAQRFAYPAAETVKAMLQRQFNCPPSSSMGRVFDAAAALLGMCTHLHYEAQAAIELEQAATRHIQSHGWPEPMPDGWQVSAQGQLDVLPVLAALQKDDGVDRAAAVFHATLVAGLTDWVMQAVASSGLHTLAWGGGCFFNKLLSYQLRENMQMLGVRVLAPVRFAPGDTSIALGQAWVVRHSLKE